MKANVAKRRVYIRVLSAFLTVYLVMMLGFSAFLIQHEYNLKSLELRSTGFQMNRTQEDVLKDFMSRDQQTIDQTEVIKELVYKTKQYRYQGIEFAVYSGDYHLMLHSNDYWLCVYTQITNYTEIQKKLYMDYAYLNPKEWFDEAQIKELEGYLYADIKAENVGDLMGYSLDLQNFWVDDGMIIPEAISVTPVYADKFDDFGNVISSIGTQENAIIYKTINKNLKQGLPHNNMGFILTSYVNPVNSNKQMQLRQMVLDEEKLKSSIQAYRLSDYERVSLFKYRYYEILPNNNSVYVIDGKNISEFWTVIACEIDLWDQCAGTLGFVWGSCFVIFMAVAIILSRQTVKNYQKREDLDRQRQDTTNALAHDLKTPLSIISGYAQNLIENIHTEKKEHYARGIQANVERMDKIILDMLELSRLESNITNVILEEIVLEHVVEDMIKRYETVCRDKSIAILLEGEMVIRADVKLIERVIDNFFINALEHTPEGGMIRITMKNGTFELFNSGSRIPDDKIKEIWLPYCKVDTSRSSKKGTGLGLAIARTILEVFHFSYGVKNVENGVVFWFHGMKD